MRARYWLLLACAAVVVLGTALWWDSGGQHWAAIHTGTCPETGPCSAGPGPYYQYHSGFGSYFPWVFLTLGGIFGWLGLHWRHINCHEPGCLRIGHVRIDDKGTLSCWHHHPEGKPRPGHILRMHQRHEARIRR